MPVPASCRIRSARSAFSVGPVDWGSVGTVVAPDESLVSPTTLSTTVGTTNEFSVSDSIFTSLLTWQLSQAALRSHRVLHERLAAARARASQDRLFFP